VKGRFELISNPSNLSVIVDYAHSPDSLQNILSSVRKLTEKRVILVFGCGGNRDKTKRPIMGNIGGSTADYCIITSDNPRKEEPLSIVNDIERGILSTACGYEKIVDRKKAIFSALNMAQQGDTVVIAGKGHENYQIIGEKYMYFDDAETVKEFFNIM
ncbi:MAG: cyanophycin synthetase, partial [Bacillota bacterium]|nr:cyanophycin synthetase [Bacillota bacterium]